jgi:hypothetical protein
MEEQIAPVCTAANDARMEEIAHVSPVASTLANLKNRRGSTRAEIKVARFFLEGCKKRALKGQAAIEELEIECCLVEENFLTEKFSALLLEREVAAIRHQKEDMENKRGLSVWPRPILHLAAGKVGDENFLYLVIKPCDFCNRGFHCCDIVVTSCKHTFHPLCLSEIVRTSNRCFVCNALFHLDWWRSWGFRGEDEEILSQELMPPLNEVHNSIIQSLKEAFAFTTFSETG